MVESYPIVGQREYGRPERSGSWINKRTTRGLDDLPLLAPHHVRVFRVGAEYIEDPGTLRADDSVVIAASSVTVVDCGAGVPVVVEMSVPSAESGVFTVRVTFGCTVTDARAVVRDGVKDAQLLLHGYLRGIPGLGEEGGDLPIVESAALRHRIQARLTAYQEMTPPLVSGVRALPFGVEVLTPEEHAAHRREIEEAKRAQEKDRIREELAEERAKAEHEHRKVLGDLRAEQAKMEERYRQEQVLREEQHRQELDRLRATYEQHARTEEQEHKLAMEGQRNGFARIQTEEDSRLIHNDPRLADLYARQGGEITASDVAARLRADEERLDERADALRIAEREYLERVDALEREERRIKLERTEKLAELTRRDTREDAAAQRQEEAHRWQQEREDRQTQREEEREEARDVRQEQRAWRERVLGFQHDLAARAMNRGHGDDMPLDVGALINSVGEMPQASAATGALERGNGGEAQELKAGPTEPTEVVDEDVSEEDDSADIGSAGMEERRGH